MKRFFLALLLFLLTLSLGAQTLIQTDDAKKLTDNVMSQLSAQKFNDGLDMLKPFSLLSAADIGTIESTLNAQLPKITPSYGKIVGTEFIAQRQVGTSLLDLKYLLKFERRALVWTFDFYNNGSGWSLLTLNYSDRLQDLFPNNIAN
jgi:hypothetical protein